MENILVNGQNIRSTAFKKGLKEIQKIISDKEAAQNAVPPYKREEHPDLGKYKSGEWSVEVKNGNPVYTHNPTGQKHIYGGELPKVTIKAPRKGDTMIHTSNPTLDLALGFIPHLPDAPYPQRPKNATSDEIKEWANDRGEQTRRGLFNFLFKQPLMTMFAGESLAEAPVQFITSIGTGDAVDRGVRLTTKYDSFGDMAVGLIGGDEARSNQDLQEAFGLANPGYMAPGAWNAHMEAKHPGNRYSKAMEATPREVFDFMKNFKTKEGRLYLGNEAFAAAGNTAVGIFRTLNPRNDKLKNNIYNNLRPYGYTGHANELKQAIKDTHKGLNPDVMADGFVPEWKKKGNFIADDYREDVFKTYLYEGYKPQHFIETKKIDKNGNNIYIPEDAMYRGTPISGNSQIDNASRANEYVDIPYGEKNVLFRRGYGVDSDIGVGGNTDFQSVSVMDRGNTYGLLNTIDTWDLNPVKDNLFFPDLIKRTLGRKAGDFFKEHLNKYTKTFGNEFEFSNLFRKTGRPLTIEQTQPYIYGKSLDIPLDRITPEVLYEMTSNPRNISYIRRDPRYANEPFPLTDLLSIARGQDKKFGNDLNLHNINDVPLSKELNYAGNDFMFKTRGENSMLYHGTPNIYDFELGVALGKRDLHDAKGRSTGEYGFYVSPERNPSKYHQEDLKSGKLGPNPGNIKIVTKTGANILNFDELSKGNGPKHLVDDLKSLSNIFSITTHIDLEGRDWLKSHGFDGVYFSEQPGKKNKEPSIVYLDKYKNNYKNKASETNSHVVGVGKKARQ